MDDIQDVFHGPLSGRSTGLRKDDLVEILIDSRALSSDSETIAKGMLIGTTRNAVEIVDEKQHNRTSFKLKPNEEMVLSPSSEIISES